MVGPAKFEGAAALEVFTLEENPHAGSRITRTTGHYRSVVRNSAMPSANGRFDRCKGTSIMSAVCTTCGGSTPIGEEGCECPPWCMRRGRRLEKKTEYWSGKRDLNPRPSPWQGDALPLSYSRAITVGQRGGILLMQERSCQAI